jgi:peptidyl-tRNA hydrolase
VCLNGSLEQILQAKVKADMLGVPNFLVVDSGCEDLNDGAPTVTAWGVGPLNSRQAKPLVKRFRLL